ncbi:MAG: FGGY-family carbohydrate kinase [Actinobacteria bacterium]|nr:FGGY-family carbohydrate kinase [Actinomycetota bacterium]
MTSASDAKRDPLLLAIDNGTQSVRALAFTLGGELAGVEKVAIEPYFSENPGWAEQHVEVYWDAVCEACRGLLGALGVDAARVAGLAVTTQRSTLVNLDTDGRPLRPAIVWLDQRRSANPPRMSRVIEAGAKLTGRGQILRELRAEAECNWIAEYQPEVVAATRRFVFLSGYLNWRLTGAFVDSAAAQVGYVPFDFKKRQWAGDGDPRWRALAVEREWLPELTPAGGRLGELTADAATAMGLPPGLPVIAAGTDKACELLGSGCLDPSTGGVSYGTTATINTVNNRYVEPIPPLPAYPAAQPDAWNSEVMIRRGYWMIEWFKRELGSDVLGNTDFDSPGAGEEAFARLEQLLSETPPGADGLLLQPYWGAGTPFPGPEARGAVIGFGDMHGRSHMYRAIVEGIAHALRDAGKRLAKRNGRSLERLRVAGGGARSDAVMQITADVFGLVAERPHVTEASGLGAAINVAVGLGLQPDYETAVARMVRVGDAFTPDPASHALYTEIHERVYSGMYKRLAPLYRSIREITGYPP